MSGKVTIVGAGPGAADLLTFRAARAIAPHPGHEKAPLRCRRHA